MTTENNGVQKLFDIPAGATLYSIGGNFFMIASGKLSCNKEEFSVSKLARQMTMQLLCDEPSSSDVADEILKSNEINKDEPLSQGELPIIDRISQAVSKFYKQNRQPHFIFLGKHEAEVLLREHHVKACVFSEYMSSVHALTGRKFMGCIVIEYPLDNFLEVV